MTNVILLVLDACRKKELKASEHVRSLRKDNIWFEKAITASTWSLPAHVSLLDGTYPHEHGVLRAGETPQGMNLPQSIDSDTYCISGNSFISPSHDFDKFFDECHYTITRKFARGKDLSNYYRDILTLKKAVRERNIRSSIKTVYGMLSDMFESPESKYTCGNLIYGTLQKITSDWESPLNRIPHPLFNSFSVYGFRADVNTNLISRTIQRHANDHPPFFIFANYMNTHRPYHPTKESQRRYLGDVLNYREIQRLNDLVSDEWNFYEWFEEHYDKTTLDKIRGLYQGEIRDVDTHIDRIINELKKNDILNDTLLVITSDHGEMLGETDPLGLPSMGHSASMSDQLINVPLLICHPALEGRVVEQPVSLTDLAPLISTHIDQLIETDGDDLGPMKRHEVVGCEIPPRGVEIEEMRNRHPDAPEMKLRMEGELSTVIGYLRDWKMAKLSSGKEFVWKDGQSVHSEEVPPQLREWVEDNLSRISDRELSRPSNEMRKHLKDLGYL